MKLFRVIRKAATTAAGFAVGVVGAPIVAIVWAVKNRDEHED